MKTSKLQYKKLLDLCCLIYGKAFQKEAFLLLLDRCLSLLKITSVSVPEDPYLWKLLNHPIAPIEKQLALYGYLLDAIDQQQKVEELQKLWVFLALFDLVQHQDRTDYLPLTLLSLRFKGVRQFLHPHSSDWSPVALTGLYASVYWTLQSLSLSFLYLLDHTPFSQLAVTLSRATLLIDKSRAAHLEEVTQYLNNCLQVKYPLISIEMKEVPLSAEDFLNNLDDKTKECNASEHSKMYEKTSFYEEKAPHFFTPEQEVEQFATKLIKAKKMFLQKTEEIYTPSSSKSLFLRRRAATEFEPACIAKLFKFSCFGAAFADSNSGRLLAKFRGFELERVFPIQYVVGKRTRIAINKSSLFPSQIHFSQANFAYLPLNKILSTHSSRQPGILRIDVRSFLEQMKIFSQGSLHKQQVYRCLHQKFFLREIPWVVGKVNQEINPAYQVLIMHSILDDCTLFGCKKDLEHLAGVLQKRYEKKWKGSLKIGFGILQENSTAASMSFEALSHLH